MRTEEQITRHKKPMVGIVGLGNMGHNMALTLASKGFGVIGTDVSESARSRLSAKDVTVVENPSELISDVEVVLLSLPSSREVNLVLDGNQGLLRQAEPGLLFIDTSTSEPENTKKLAKIAMKHGHEFVDAPVSGGPTGAADGTLSIMFGGSQQAVHRARPVLEGIGDKLAHMGEVSSGHTTKILNNFLVASNLAIVGEVFKLGKQQGVSPENLVKAVNNGTGRSGVSEVFMNKFILPRAFDSGFTMKLMRKDVELAKELANAISDQLPVSSAIVERWRHSISFLEDEQDFTHMADPFLNEKESEQV